MPLKRTGRDRQINIPYLPPRRLSDQNTIHMKLNRIQIQILTKLSRDLELDMKEYLARFSQKYTGRVINELDELTEREGDTWITKAYLESLG